MIFIEAVVKGERDVPPLTRIFDYNTADEELFLSSASIIKKKLERGLRINSNEALIVYCSHIVNSIRSGHSVVDMKQRAPKILSRDDVMIGVPETLRTITFNAKIDGRASKRIKLDEPIPTSSYILT